MTTETDYIKAILQIADANNIIKEKTTSIESLQRQEEELNVEITRYETSRDEIKKEAQDSANELERIKLAISTTKENEEKNVNVRIEELDTKEADLVEREKSYSDSLIEIERNRAEGQKITEDNTKAQANVDSKLEEAKRLSSQRKDETNALETKRSEAETATKRMEEQVKELEKATAEHEKARKGSEESRKGAEILHDEVNKSRETAERARQESISENNCAEYNKGMAKNLLEVFRQALHSYCQINGTAIQIAELTNEHKKWIAKDLMSQAEENSPKE